MILYEWKCLQTNHIERRQKLLHLHISWTNTFTGIVPWPPYLTPFHLTDGVDFLQASLCLLQLFKFIEQIILQVLSRGNHILLFYTWQMEQSFSNLAFVSCISSELLGDRSSYCNKMPIICVIVEIIQWGLIALMEGEILSQKSGCPHFFDCIRNTSTKAHRFT